MMKNCLDISALFKRVEENLRGFLKTPEVWAKKKLT